MATANRTSFDNLEKLSWYLDHCAHTAWDTFSVEQQRKMVEDDLMAGTSVSLVLASLITAGLVLSIVTLWVVLLVS